MIKQRSNLTLPVSLYAIGNVKDELNLHTGELTHRIGKIELTGTEIWLLYNDNYYSSVIDSTSKENRECVCSHLRNSAIYVSKSSTRLKVYSKWVTDVASTVDEWKQFIMDEYAAGHPVTVWYILETPTTETVTVPEGLSGIVEGYLIQNGTPTPTNPIYPTSCDSVDMWNEVMYRQYGVNETLSPIPTTVFSQGDGIDSCTVYGNTVQNGTPTPTDPVDVNGVGIKIGNLFDKDSAVIGERVLKSSVTADESAAHSDYIDVTGISTLTVNKKFGTSTNFYFYADKTNTSIGYVNDFTANVPTGAKYCRINVFKDDVDTIMLNTGSTPLPYEPYGYKVGLDIDSQITNIYLGEVQTTRRIKKLVLTGNEVWGRVDNCFRLSCSNSSNSFGTIISTHFKYAGPWSLINTAAVGACVSATYYSTAYKFLMIRCDDIATTVPDFKAYLAAQYAAGTPVTVYYVLAEPQTTTLNEPLMKIGDYADSVTYSSNIPTTYGQNDITTDTQIKPSKLDITYNALRRAKVYKNNRWILNPSIDWSQTLKISDLQSKKIKEMEGEYIGYNIHT